MSQATEPARTGLETATKVYQIQNGTFTPVIPCDFILHSKENPFCYNPACSCHEDELNIAETMVFVTLGLFSPEEATRFIQGEMI
jgi:hypothetical protein